MKIARDEYDMQFNIAMRWDDWIVFDMDTGNTFGKFETREAALRHMKRLNDEARAK